MNRVFGLLGLVIVVGFAAKGRGPYKVMMVSMLMLFGYAYCHKMAKHLRVLEARAPHDTETIDLLYEVAVLTSVLGVPFAHAVLAKDMFLP
jgi:hypothetical protein